MVPLLELVYPGGDLATGFHLGGGMAVLVNSLKGRFDVVELATGERRLSVGSTKSGIPTKTADLVSRDDRGFLLHRYGDLPEGRKFHVELITHVSLPSLHIDWEVDLGIREARLPGGTFGRGTRDLLKADEVLCHSRYGDLHCLDRSTGRSRRTVALPGFRSWGARGSLLWGQLGDRIAERSSKCPSPVLIDGGTGEVAYRYDVPNPEGYDIAGSGSAGRWAVFRLCGGDHSLASETGPFENWTGRDPQSRRLDRIIAIDLERRALTLDVQIPWHVVSTFQFKDDAFWFFGHEEDVRYPRLLSLGLDGAILRHEAKIPWLVGTVVDLAMGKNRLLAAADGFGVHSFSWEDKEAPPMTYLNKTPTQLDVLGSTLICGTFSRRVYVADLEAAEGPKRPRKIDLGA